MSYDSKKFEMDLAALRHNRDVAKEHFHKICGAIEITEAMLKACLEAEEKAAAEAVEAETCEQATMDTAQEAA